MLKYFSTILTAGMMAQREKERGHMLQCRGYLSVACVMRKNCAKIQQARIGFKMAPRRPSEEELGRKWDRCFVDTTFKTGILEMNNP